MKLGLQSPSEPQSHASILKLGWIVVAAVFGGLFLWSVAAPIEGAIVAPGQIVVASNRKAVQHLEGGVIGEIRVKEGQKVAAGEVVARLEDTVQRANAALIDGQLSELYARRARLTAERDNLDDVADGAGVAEILSATGFEEKLEGQRQLFVARRQTIQTQIKLLEERINQQQQRAGGLSVQIKSLSAQRRLINDELAGVKELHAQGFAPLTRVRALERESERLLGERGALQAGIAEAESVIAEAQFEIERTKDAAREGSISELRDVEVKIAELEEQRIAAIDALRRTELRAPQAGTVLGLAVHTTGGVIGPGAPIMEIVPSEDRLRVSARLSPRDVDKVYVGQETAVRFTGLGARSSPEVTGVVETLSSDSFVDEGTGSAFYLVYIGLPNDDELARVLKKQKLTPGMPTEIFIRTGSQPAISYLLRPLTDAFARSMKEE